MLITLLLDIKFPANQSCKCCLNRFDSSDITNLIWHPCTDIVFKKRPYVQFVKVHEKPWIFRIESLYDEVDKLDRLSKDFGNITVPFEVRCQSNAEVYD